MGPPSALSYSLAAVAVTRAMSAGFSIAACAGERSRQVVTDSHLVMPATVATVVCPGHNAIRQETRSGGSNDRFQPVDEVGMPPDPGMLSPVRELMSLAAGKERIVVVLPDGHRRRA